MRQKSLKQRWHAMLRRHLWGIRTIHPSAWIAASAHIDRTWPKGIHIGRDCVIDEEVIVLAHDLTRGIYVDTVIGDGTIVGPRALIMPGVKVGKHCRIAPGAVVVRDVPDDHEAIGNPAIVSPRS
jgi:acetyltransferase-like isoleucine patch superfamily enzyme